MARRMDPANGGWLLLLIGILTSIALDNPLHWDVDDSRSRDSDRAGGHSAAVSIISGNHASPERSQPS